MKESKLLYKIKNLEKNILKMFNNDIFNEVKNGEMLLPPTPTQMQIIEYIIEHPKNDVYQKDLEEVLNLTRATISGVLQTMEKNHLIERIVNTNDIRSKKIILNVKTKEMFLRNQQKILEIEKVLVNNISNEELEFFYKILDKMQNNIKNNL